jgi:hypothetical protein
LQEVLDRLGEWVAENAMKINPSKCKAVLFTSAQLKNPLRRQRTDIGKYSFVNGTIRLWNRLPAEILGTLPYKPSAFRKRVRRVINY